MSSYAVFPEPAAIHSFYFPASDAIVVDSGVQLPADPAGSGPHCIPENPKNLIEHGDLKIRIEGDLVPVVDVWLGGQQGIFFEHHTLLWKHASLNLSIRQSSLSGSFHRFFSGIQVFQAEAHGPGNLALSREGVGQIVSLLLSPGDTIDVREHQFLLASANLHYSVSAISGGSSVLLPGTGMFVDSFTAGMGQEGVVIIHGYGNVFEKTLGPGECIDIEPGAWLWKDGSVQIQTIVVGQNSQQNASQPSSLNSSFGGLGKLVSMMHSNLLGGFRMTRFIGPGRVALQSMTCFAPAAFENEKKGDNHFHSSQSSMSSFAQF
ncbi:mitochondrial biogenesis AIM24-domain-containing protein [Obelidium mucronatum]|nr:mitochondrial biogenesis AIM24-domain-containing protein [Obelidium mucronatum]